MQTVIILISSQPCMTVLLQWNIKDSILKNTVATKQLSPPRHFSKDLRLRNNIRQVWNDMKVKER